MIPRRAIFRSLLLALAVLLVGVNVSSWAQQDESPHLTRTSSLAGTWVGTYKSNKVGETRVTLIFQQLGATVTGTYLSGNGAQGVMWGLAMADGSAKLVAEQKTPTCPGHFSMPVEVADNAMTWEFEGVDCLGDEDGTGTANRQ